MKVGIFTYDFYPIIWGQWTHLYSLYQELIKSIPDQFLIFSPCNNLLPNHIQIASKFRSKYWKNIGFSLRLYFNIEHIIKRYWLTQVHIHWWPWWLFMPKKLSVPIIYTCHHTYRQQMHYIKSQRRKYPFYLLEKLSYHKANKIICVSPDTSKRLVEEYNIKLEKVITIPNAVDLKFWQEENKGHKKKKTLLYVGRIDERKWINKLIDIMPELLKQDNQITLSVIWKWELLEDLQKKVQSNNISKNVFFRWFVDENEKRKAMLESEVLIMPSIFEGFGIVALEWIATGCKVIANDTDWLRVFGESKNVKLVDIDNSKNLVQSIISFINKKDSLVIDQSFLLRFDIINIANQYVDFYTNLDETK